MTQAERAIRAEKAAKQHFNRKYKSLKGRAGCLFRSARDRAARKGLPFDLTVDWVLTRLKAGSCEVTGFGFEFGPHPDGAGGRHPYGPSVHRVEPALGYTQENCQMVTWLYNRALGPYKHEVLMGLARRLVELEGKA